MPTPPAINRVRRVLLKLLGLGGGLTVLRQAQAHHVESHFEESSAHNIVYQCNQADPDYLQHILFSAGELLRRYGDDVQIVIVAFGPGLHLLGRKPERPIPIELQQKASSLAQYGVAFHACGNTMLTLNWTDDDLLPFAKMVPIGAEDIMLMQEQGFAYISW